MAFISEKRISSSPSLPRRFTTGNVLILLSTCLGLGLAMHLPQWVAWENGPLESAQNFVLFAGCWVAVRAACEFRHPSSKALCMVAMLFWLAFLGREVAWGAVFMPPTEDSPWGPVWSSRQLVYRPLVPYVIGWMAVCAAYVWVRYQVWSVVVVKLARARALPLFALLQFVGCMVISSGAEGRGLGWLHDGYGMNAMVLEEWAEVCGYLALLLAQATVFYHLRQRETR